MMEEVDQEIINELLTHISKEDYHALVDDFIDNTRHLLLIITKTEFLKDKTAVIRAVHTIKGNAISLGFNRLSKDSAILEEELKTLNKIEKSSIFAGYNSRVTDFLNSIKNYIDK